MPNNCHTNLLKLLSLILLASSFTKASPTTPNNFETFLIVPTLIHQQRTYYRSNSPRSPTAEGPFARAYRFFAQVQDFEGMQICGLRAIMNEKRHDLIPGVLRAFLFEFGLESFRTDRLNSSKSDRSQMGPMDAYKFCLGHGEKSDLRDKAYK